MRMYLALLAIGLVFISMTVASGVYAEEGTSTRVLEEVVVTATKRESDLQDAPLAVSVIPSDKMRVSGMAELEDLAHYVPNVHVAEGGTGTQLFIRGVGSGINYGFEQSVGIFIDGVYFGRGRSARTRFLDIDRVEILKGPQTTLFGKNTIAGAVNITTASPTEETERYVDDRYQLEPEGRTLSTVLSGEVSESWFARFTAQLHKDDGYVENTFRSDDGPLDDSWIARVSVLHHATPDTQILAKFEHATIEVLGRQDMIAIASPAATALYQTYGDPDFDADLDYEKSSADLPGSTQRDDTESDIVQVTINSQFDGFSLQSISAYTHYDFENVLDADYGPLAFLEVRREEQYDQFSQEWVLRSDLGGAFDYLLGFYYHQGELTSDSEAPVLFSALPPVEADLLTQVNDALMIGAASGDLDGMGNGRFSQQTDILSFYGQTTWHMNPRLRVNLGMRYSHERKDMEKSRFTTDINGSVDATLAQIYDEVLGFSRDHTLALERTETHWTGRLGIEFDLQPDWLLYGNVANGSKAGGFDESNAFGLENDAEFDDEYVESIELGSKSEFWDGKGRVNVSWFHSEFDDLQVSTFDGNAGFVVGNAASATVEGVELDVTSLLTESTSLLFSLAYLDAHYTSFSDAACRVDQIAKAEAATGSRDCQQDLSGKPLQFSPTWAANVSLSYDSWLWSVYPLRASVDVNWVDDTVVANDMDENLIQERYYKLHAFVQVSTINEDWVFTLVGKNLTNETTFSWGNDVPFGAFGFDETYFAHVDPPRTVEFQVRFNF